MNATTFLSQEEIERVTGRKYAPAQKRVIARNAIRFTVDAAGRPIVLRASMEKLLLGQAVSAEPVLGPDFTFFPKVG